MPGQNLLKSWWFLSLNWLLVALVCLCLVRSILALFEPLPGNVVTRLVRSLTDVIVKPVRFATPAIIGPRLVPLFAVAWLLSASLLLRLVAQILSARPRIGLL